MYMCFYNSNRNQFSVDIDMLDIETVSLNPRSAYKSLLSGAGKHPDFKVTSCLRFVTTDVKFDD